MVFFSKKTVLDTFSALKLQAFFAIIEVKILFFKQKI
jgi:hypothetical protein